VRQTDIDGQRGDEEKEKDKRGIVNESDINMER